MMMKKRTFNSIYWLPVMIWMIVIFYLSHQPADQSSELSAGILEFVLHLFSIEGQTSILHFIIRKAAHFFAYFVLGVLVLIALKKWMTSRWKTIIFSWFICVCYAISDEIHQYFIPGRSCEIRDVLIDSMGAGFGIILSFLLFKKRKRL